MINRRTFFGSGLLAGIGGYFFPRKLEASEDRPERGLSNGEMRELCSTTKRQVGKSKEIGRSWLNNQHNQHQWKESFDDPNLKLITIIEQEYDSHRLFPRWPQSRYFVRYNDNYWQEVGGRIMDEAPASDGKN